MAITQLITLDPTTLNTTICSSFRTCTHLMHVAADCYKFEFEPIVIQHALQLLSFDPSRYGIDLQDYLAPVVQYYSQHSPSQFTDLAFGTTDFKRRAAENLGASLASLLMATVLNVRWESITQIQSAKKQRGRKPDFVGYSDSSGYLFEAKGTSRPQTMGKQIKDASDQLKSLPLGGRGKIGFASFFPGEIGRLCPSTHVFDPPSNTIVPERGDAVLRHYVHKLSFLELNQSMALLSDYMDAKLLSESAADVNVRSRAEDRTDALKAQFLPAFAEEKRILESISTSQGEFLARRKDFNVTDQKVRFEVSCRTEFLDPFLPPADNVRVQTRHSGERHGAESTFSDGTRIKLDWD